MIAGDEKKGQGNDIPLRSDLATELKAWIAESESESAEILKLPGKKESGDCGDSGYSNPAISEKLLFVVPSGLVRILNRELKAAKIPKTDERGYTVDVHAVHALRHSFAFLWNIASTS